MASRGVNKVIIEQNLYVCGMSIPEVSQATGIPLSTLRFRFKKAGILRSRHQGVIQAAKRGRMSGSLGVSRNFTPEWCMNISKSKKGKGKGFSLKPSGYIDITMGENKFRGQHVVVMESAIGRRIQAHECVHHVDHNKQNNDLDNLRLMTKSEHSRHHALEALPNRNRDTLGRFL